MSKLVGVVFFPKHQKFGHCTFAKNPMTTQIIKMARVQALNALFLAQKIS